MGRTGRIGRKGGREMLEITLTAFLAVTPTIVSAQAQRADATLRITVVDPSGAVIVGARVDIKPIADGSTTSLDTGGRGDATFTLLEPGRYALHVEAPGFEPHDARELRLRPGETRREIKLEIAKIA